MKIKFILQVLVCVFVISSCQKENAANKINKNNLETAQSRDAKIKSGSPEITFDKTQFNFGTVNEGDIVETEFVITNTGKSDLIITDAQPSCGCTVPEWPRSAIKPGSSEKIKVKFDTNGKPNRQIKTITLTTNTVKGREVLKVSGMVTPKNNS